MNLDTLEVLDGLTEECMKALEKINSKAKKVTEILENKKDPVYEAISLGWFKVYYLFCELSFVLSVWNSGLFSCMKKKESKEPMQRRSAMLQG